MHETIKWLGYKCAEYSNKLIMQPLLLQKLPCFLGYSFVP